VRVRSILALLLAGMLLAAGVASAQETTTEPLGDYTTTTPTVTTPAESPGSDVGGDEGSGGGDVPAVGSQPAGNAPSSLAFTGADPLLLIALGLGLAGGTTALLVRERRRSTQER
jgi:hypothetical protein